MVSVKRRGLSSSLTNGLSGVSKEGRRQINCGQVDVVRLEINESDHAHAAKLNPFVERARAPAHSDPRFVAYNRIRKLEYDQLYAADGLDPANQELTSLSAAAVVRGLGLSPDDNFLDLGSATGVLTLVAASKCRRAAGVELSRASHEIASESKRRFLATFPQARIDLYQSDLKRFSTTEKFDVIYCGIRGRRSRPRVIAVFLDNLLRNLRHPVRFVCAGFGLDDTPLPPCQIELRQIYCIKKKIDAGLLCKKNDQDDIEVDDIQSTEPLYGDHRGPRLLLEYMISPPSSSTYFEDTEDR